MIVKIALIGATEAEEVIALQHGNVVAEDTCPGHPRTACGHSGCLRYRARGLSGLAEGFQGSTEVGELRRTAGSVPCPVIAEVAEMEVVGGIGGNVGGQPGNEIPRLLRTVGNRSGCAQRVARKETADIGLRCWWF